MGEQLTGTDWPRKTITGWVGSLLHCSMDAVAPGENPVPETFKTSPPARPEQLGADEFELLQLAPAAEVVRLRVVPGVLPVEAQRTEVVSIPPPTRTARTPAVATVCVSFRCAPTVSRSPPFRADHGQRRCAASAAAISTSRGRLPIITDRYQGPTSSRLGK